MNNWVVKKILGINATINIDPLQSIKRISPSRFFGYSQCKLREVLAASNGDGFLPLNPEAYFGRAAHKLLEKVGKRIVLSPEELEEKWVTCLAEVEQILANDYVTKYLVPLGAVVKRYEVKKRLLFNLATSLIPPPEKSCGDKQSKGGSELWLESSNQVVGGFADKILNTVSGYEILDYKTGQVTDENGIKPEYSIQLKLYAVIFFETYNEWPTALKIIDRNGAIHNISFTAEECIQLLEEASAIFRDVNEIIESDNSLNQKLLMLATPSPESCRYCTFRPVCISYWQQKCFSTNIQWPNDLVGTIVNIEILGNKMLLIKLDYNNIIYKIRGIDPQKYELKVNETYKFYNLIKDKADNYYSSAVLTTIYSE